MMRGKKLKNKAGTDEKFGLDEFIHSNFKLSLRYLGESREYLWLASILFFAIILLGFLYPVFFQKEILDLLRQLIAKTEGFGAFELTRFIFINNLKSSFFAIFFGIFFGIIPLAVLIINAYILGFVANKTIDIEGYLVLWRLFPHGIFEIPAVLISIAVGLRLGMFLFVSKEKTLESFGKNLLDALRVFVFIVIPLLILAAIIEGFLIALIG